MSALVTMRRARLAEVVDGLRRARADSRVRALVAKVGGRRIGLGGLQELRDAVAEFGQSGKLTVAWTETFGDFSAGNLPYYLATAFDRIYLQPSGDLGLTGVAVEQVFLRTAMDKLGVDYEVGKRREYKSAADMLTERGFTGPAREATERLTASISAQLTDAIARRRGIGAEQARALIDRGPFLAAEALELGLVDELGYRDEVYAAVRRKAGQDAVTQYVGRYRRSRVLARRVRTLPNPQEQFVALIHASGPIRRGSSGRGPLAPAMGSDTVTSALRTAAKDQRAKAILLRVNSPGGSYVASDAIWREVVRARAAGKPVVVSMGDVAASGGYFIAMAADVIVAQPGTLTGSIGVIVAKPVVPRPARPGRDQHRLGGRGSARDDVRPDPPVQRGRVGPDQHLAGPDLRGLHRQGRRRAPDDRGAGGGGGPRPGLDRRGRPGPVASSTSWAGWRPPRYTPAAGPACPPARRCGSTRGSARWTGCARRSRARPRPPLPARLLAEAWGPVRRRSPPGRASRRTGR